MEAVKRSGSLQITHAVRPCVFRANSSSTVTGRVMIPCSNAYWTASSNAWIVPGRDDSHATSAARYLEECLPCAEYWDVPVAGQTEDSASKRLLEFLDTAAAAAR
jgi:hypothetical protein